MDQKSREHARAVRQAAIDEAIDWRRLAQDRGMTPMTTVITAAMLIGQIVGASADDEARMESGLEQILSMARAAAKDWLSVRTAPRH
jgi:hypothetical protein